MVATSPWRSTPVEAWLPMLIHMEEASRRDASVDPVEGLAGAMEDTLGELSELGSDEDLSFADRP